MPKLFLASGVQHVYQCLLPIDKTFLPVQIWFVAEGGEGEDRSRGGEGNDRKKSGWSSVPDDAKVSRTNVRQCRFS